MYMIRTVKRLNKRRLKLRPKSINWLPKPIRRLQLSLPKLVLQTKRTVTELQPIPPQVSALIREPVVMRNQM